MIVPEKPEEWRGLPSTYSANDTTARGIHLVAGLISVGDKSRNGNLVQIALQVSYQDGVTKYHRLSLRGLHSKHGLPTIEQKVEEDIMHHKGQQIYGQVGLNITRPGGVPIVVVNYLNLPSLEVVVKNTEVTFYSQNRQVIYPAQH